MTVTQARRDCPARGPCPASQGAAKARAAIMIAGPPQPSAAAAGAAAAAATAVTMTVVPAAVPGRMSHESLSVCPGGTQAAAPSR